MMKTSTTEYSETHELDNFVSVKIEVKRTNEKDWQGEIWVAVTGNEEPLLVYSFTRPGYLTLNDLLSTTRAQIALRASQVATLIDQSMRGASDA